MTVTSNSNWTASSSVPWLTLSPSSGSGNGSIAANVTLASAAVGPNQATITVTSGGVTRTTAVTLTVAATSLTAAPSSLTYTATQGAANPAAQTITISANGAWTVSDNASWLNLSSTSGSGNGVLTVTATTGSLSSRDLHRSDYRQRDQRHSRLHPRHLYRDRAFANPDRQPNRGDVLRGAGRAESREPKRDGQCERQLDGQ